MPTLHELVLCRDPDGASVLERLHACADEHDGDVTSVEAALAPLWEAHERSLSQKVESIAWVIRELDSRATAQRGAAADLTAAAERTANAARRVREYVMRTMDEAGVARLAGATCELRIQRNGGVTPLVVDDGADLPDAFIRTTVHTEPDKAAIRAALERGDDVPGCRLGERGRSLRLR
jgi:hypothetical protein